MGLSLPVYRHGEGATQDAGRSHTGTDSHRRRRRGFVTRRTGTARRRRVVSCRVVVRREEGRGGGRELRGCSVITSSRRS